MKGTCSYRKINSIISLHLKICLVHRLKKIFLWTKRLICVSIIMKSCAVMGCNNDIQRQYEGYNRFQIRKGFFVNSCGITHTNEDYSVIREFGRNDYHILYVTKGNCYIEKENSIITLDENDIFIYYPHEMQMYSFDSKENISYWIHFSGYEVENLLLQLNLTAGKHRLDEFNNISALFNSIQKEYSTYSIIKDETNQKAKISKIKNKRYICTCIWNVI